MKGIIKLSMRRRLIIAATALKIVGFAAFGPACETFRCDDMVVVQKQAKKDEIIKDISTKPIDQTKSNVFAYLKSAASEKDKTEVINEFTRKYGERALDALIADVTLNFGFNNFESYTEAVKNPDRSAQFTALARGIANFKEKGFQKALETVLKIDSASKPGEFVLAHGILTEAVFIMIRNGAINKTEASEKLSETLQSDNLSHVSRQTLLQWLGKIEPNAVCEIRDRAPVGDLRTMASDHVDYLTRKLGAIPCRTDK